MEIAKLRCEKSQIQRFMTPILAQQTSPEIDFQEEVAVAELSDIHDLVVHNDEVNTFDHVIDALIEICEHSPEQAEQCTLLIHHKGKFTVKIGAFETLAEMRAGICNRGINAEIQ